MPLAADLRGLDVKLAGTTNRSGTVQYVIETYRDERLLAGIFSMRLLTFWCNAPKSALAPRTGPDQDPV